MDTRRSSEFDLRPRQATEDAFTSHDAELVELRLISPATGGPGWRLLFGGGILALSGLIAMAGFPSGGTETSAAAEPTFDQSAPSAPLPAPTFVAATPPAAAVPRVRTWAATALTGYDSMSTVTDVWSVDGGFVALVSIDASSGTESIPMRSTDGSTWKELTTGPMRIHDAVGTVASGRLWLVEQPGDDHDGALWWTENGVDWGGPDPIDGLLDANSEVRSLTAGAAGWVAVTARRGLHGSDGVRFSRNGIAWARVATPFLDDGGWIVDVAANDERWVMVVASPTEDAGVNRMSAYTSTSGRQWLEHPIGVVAGIGRDLVHGPAGYVLVGEEWGDGRSHAITWLSEDGGSWLPFRQPAGADRRPAGMDLVTSTDEGYLAFNRVSGDAWFSVDGRDFVSDPAVDSAQVEAINAIAAWHAILVAAGRRPGLPTIWHTELASMAQM